MLTAFFSQGLIYGQLGPTLPDLQKISGVQLEKASWIFTGYGIGYLLGCLVGGICKCMYNTEYSKPQRNHSFMLAVFVCVFFFFLTLHLL